MGTKSLGYITKIFDYGYTVKTQTGETGTLKKESLSDEDVASKFYIGGKVAVYDNGRRSMKGGILWDLKPTKSTFSMPLNNDENIAVLPSENQSLNFYFQRKEPRGSSGIIEYTSFIFYRGPR